jgi:hypothetical protein
MAPILTRLAGLALIMLGVAFFPFALMGFLVSLGGSAPLGLGMLMIAVDAVFLFAGATGVVGLWRRSK